MTESSGQPDANESANEDSELDDVGAAEANTRDTRPTLTYLRELFEANGLAPRRQLGQNFLVDLNILDLIVRAARVGPRDVVLEVGAGTGGLTTRLSDAVAQVISVEIDPGMYRLACHATASRSNVSILNQDVLKGKNHMAPEVIAAVEAAIVREDAKGYHLVANLPYDVATSVIGNLLVHPLPIRSMTVTVQLEVGQRIAAKPGGSNYGPLAALARRVAYIHWIRTLPASVFWPKPRIKSAILRLEISQAKRAACPDLAEWNRFVRDLFIHRRKNLRAAIASMPGHKTLKPTLDGMLSELGLRGDARAETLSPEALYQLFHAIRDLKADMEATQ